MDMRALPLLIFLLTLSILKAVDRPNIIFIMADDMGYGDPQCMNPTSKIPTPGLDRLAREGMTFTDAHSPSAVCTPTRYGVLTGRYCWRSKLKRGVLNGYGEPLIDKDRVTVADVLSQNGYHTAAVGKWHLGFGFSKQGQGKKRKFDFSKPIDHGPNQLGFDYFHGLPASLDFPPYVYIENDRLTQFPSLRQEAIGFPKYLRPGERSPDFIFEESLDYLLDKATKVIQKQAATTDPFFLYFPLTSPHKPVYPHARFVGKSGLGPYGDFVMQTDWIVGQVLDVIDAAEIAENTLVIFTSDNGSFMRRLTDTDQPDHVTDEKVQGYFPHHHRANGALRGTKADIWEAGHRVPFFARWPGKVAAGSQCHETICHVDLTATCAEIIGVPLPSTVAEDSFSVLPLLKGKDWERAPVIHHSGAGMFAIREGKWKLVYGNGSGGRAKPRGKADQGPFMLFDLSKDTSETTDRASERPEIVARLAKKLLEIRQRGGSRPASGSSSLAPSDNS